MPGWIVSATENRKEKPESELEQTVPTENPNESTLQDYQVVYQRPLGLTALPSHYCPGCTHGTAHRIVAEVLGEQGLIEDTVGIASVGCAVFSYLYFNCDFVEAPHGRAPAVATGIKRLLPQKTVFTYQGDGDLASIGMGEIVHAAARGERITVIFINNAIYGMTGGQMAPTTVLGQKTSSCVQGRSAEASGSPIRMCELLATLDGCAYAVRRSLHSPKCVRQAKRAVQLAFQAQRQNRGLSVVELLSTCPTNWGLSPVDAEQWLEKNMLPVFPLGDYKVHPALKGAGDAQ